MNDNDKPGTARERADAKFEKTQRQDRERAEIHNEAAKASRARDVNTARLRGLRLEKEAADAVTATELAAQKAAAKAAGKPKRRAPKAKDATSEPKP